MQLHEMQGTLRFGKPLAEARGAVILIHGRGASAQDIAGLADALPEAALAFLAPEARGGAWYPQRFLAPLERNEPWLSSALEVVGQLAGEAQAAGISSRQLGLVGFSQGACLALEFAARQPRRYGFVAALSGALIGPLDTVRPPADLEGTPFLLGCAESDPHIPVEYVEKSAETLTRLGGKVTKQIYRGAAHTVFPEEIAWLARHAADLPQGSLQG